MLSVDEARIGIIGLGYVGLPLAVEFGKVFSTIGYDINRHRINELRNGIDSTQEVDSEELAADSQLSYADSANLLEQCNVYIVTVPTPIDKYKRPDLNLLKSSSQLIGELLSPGDVIIYESTVYPGATEEVCVPVLEAASGLKFNKEFFTGYSPERINPGDKQHRITTIKKITSGSTREAADFVDELYRRIITAGTHKASSMRVAEAAKVIENTQRDVNIALINELALIFNELGIDTIEVLEAAGTKWNFLPFRPGLVGGHCVGVDPYYLTHKAQEIGYTPEVILAGRRINDSMGTYIATQVFKLMCKANMKVSDSRILVMGLTFKENCPDLRNSRVTDIISELESYTANVDIFDPMTNVDEAEIEYGICPIKQPLNGVYDAVILAVAHDQFKQMGAATIRAYGKPNCVLYDVKHILPVELVDGRL